MSYPVGDLVLLKQVLKLADEGKYSSIKELLIKPKAKSKTSLAWSVVFGKSSLAWSVVLVIAVSLVFYQCVHYSEWYIDELFAITRNEDARGLTPLKRVNYTRNE